MATPFGRFGQISSRRVSYSGCAWHSAGETEERMPLLAGDKMADRSLASRHRASAEFWGDRVALRFKRDGQTRDLSWADYRRQADQAAAALIELGVSVGDRIGLLAENRSEWLVADIALLSAGVAGVTMHAPLAPGQVEYQLAHSEARGVIVSTQEQADKVLGRLSALPALEFLVSFEPVDVSGKIPHFTWDALLDRGRQLGGEGLERVRRREGELDRDSLATLIYTSGTTGPPKGVMLSHGNLLSNAEAVHEMVDVGTDDVALSWLPFSHIYARTIDHYLTFLTGGLIFLAQSMDTVLADLADAQPTVMNAVPRFYEKVWSFVEALEPTEPRRRLRGLFGPRLRWLFSGGAPLPRHVCAGFHEAGLLLLEGYGLTEASPTISFNRVERFKIGTVGQAIPGVEVKIADDGEILTRGPHVMRGYWKDPEATERVIVDGWLHTGDLGRLDEEGFLTITGRKKDLIITSGGKNISPNELERILQTDPLIDQAILYGDGKPFLSALIVPDLEGVRAQARALGCALEYDGEFISSPPVRDFLAARIERLMEAVSKPERVKAFVLLGRPFSVEAGELTLTQKVRRSEILNKFRDRFDALYAQEPPGKSWDV